MQAKLQKTLDSTLGGGYCGSVMVNSMARFGTRNISRRIAPKSQSAFFVLSDIFGGMFAEAFEPTGFLLNRVPTVFHAAIFRLEPENGGYPQILFNRRISMSRKTSPTNVIPFSYQSTQVRTIKDEAGQAWFVAKDVCHVLEHSNPSMAIQNLDDDERAKKSLGRQGDTWVINESGLYTLILRSNKPEARPFRKWVTSEVLPAIRRTGAYSTALTPLTLTEAQQKQIHEAVKTKVDGLFYGGSLMKAAYITVWTEINKKFGVETYKKIPVDKADDVLRFIRNMKLVKGQIEAMEPFGGSLPMPENQMRDEIKAIADQVSSGNLDFIFGCLLRMKQYRHFFIGYSPKEATGPSYGFMNGSTCGTMCACR